MTLGHLRATPPGYQGFESLSHKGLLRACKPGPGRTAGETITRRWNLALHGSYRTQQDNNTLSTYVHATGLLGYRVCNACNRFMSGKRNSGAGSTFKVLIISYISRLAQALLLQTFFNPDEYWQCLEIAHFMAFG